MIRQSVESAPKEILTTGEAAKFCSVTANTILRWITEGKLPAIRTSGGHNRIARADLLKYMQPEEKSVVPRPTDKVYQYCWEFHSSSGVIRDECFKCIVYRSRSGRCYELAKIRSEVGHSRLCCSKTCQECDYYIESHNRCPSLMVVTQEIDSRLLDAEKDLGGSTVRFVENEYQCCLEIDKVKPDYIVIDCSLGAERCLDLVKQLTTDKRIPFAKLILVGIEEQFPAGCSGAVFAFVRSPFRLETLTELIAGL